MAKLVLRMNLGPGATPNETRINEKSILILGGAKAGNLNTIPVQPGRKLFQMNNPRVAGAIAVGPSPIVFDSDELLENPVLAEQMISLMGKGSLVVATIEDPATPLSVADILELVDPPAEGAEEPELLGYLRLEIESASEGLEIEVLEAASGDGAVANNPKPHNWSALAIYSPTASIESALSASIAVLENPPEEEEEGFGVGNNIFAFIVGNGGNGGNGVASNCGGGGGGAGFAFGCITSGINTGQKIELTTIAQVGTVTLSTVDGSAAVGVGGVGGNGGLAGGNGGNTVNTNLFNEEDFIGSVGYGSGGGGSGGGNLTPGSPGSVEGFTTNLLGSIGSISSGESAIGGGGGATGMEDGETFENDTGAVVFYDLVAASIFSAMTNVFTDVVSTASPTLQNFLPKEFNANGFGGGGGGGRHFTTGQFFDNGNVSGGGYGAGTGLAPIAGALGGGGGGGGVDGSNSEGGAGGGFCCLLLWRTSKIED